MFTKEYWFGDNGALVRALRTWAQTAVASIGVGQTNLFTADMKNVLALATSAAIISLLMSIDRREALYSPPPTQATRPAPQPAAVETVNTSDPASADYRPMS